MRPSRIAKIAIAAVFITTPSAFAQTQSTQPQTRSSDTAKATQTFTGCLMTEPDYRHAHNLGGGAVGGMGLGDEFVLVDVKVSPAKNTGATALSSDASGASTSSQTRSTSPTQTASAVKCADQGTAYRLTGADEEKVKALVGKHVEVQGRLKHADAAATGAKTPPEKLPAEVEIISFREVSGRDALTATQPIATQPTPAQSTPPTATPELRSRQDAAQSRTTRERELPRTASSTGWLVLIGVLALSSGIALSLFRRRAS